MAFEPLPLTDRPGVRAPAWSTSTGRLLLASLPPDRLRSLLAHATDAPATLARHLESVDTREGSVLVEDAGAVIQVSCLLTAPVPLAIELQIPAMDAQRHGTEHLAGAIQRLAAMLGAAG